MSQGKFRSSYARSARIMNYESPTTDRITTRRKCEKLAENLFNKNKLKIAEQKRELKIEDLPNVSRSLSRSRSLRPKPL